MTAPTNLLAKVEAVRRRVAVDDAEGKLRDIGSRVAACADDRDLLLQALDRVMKGLSEEALVQIVTPLEMHVPSSDKEIHVHAGQSIVVHHGPQSALSVARAIRASLGLTQGSAGE